MRIRLLDLLNHIDEAIEAENHGRALQLILENWYNLPDAAPLRERTAMLLATVGRKREAVEVYSRVARHYANAGFPTRALAAIKQMQSLNPSSTQLFDHFTTLYSVRSPFLERDMEQSNIPEPAHALELEIDGDDDLDVDALFEEALERATDPEGTAERPGSLPALPLLSLLPPKALRRVLDFMEYEIYAEAQPVIGADNENQDLFWAVSSDLIVDHEDQQFLIPAGTLLGVNAFRRTPNSVSHTVMSQKGSECLRLSEDSVASLTEEFPDLPNRLATLYRHALTERLFEHHPMFADLDETAITEFPSHLVGLKLDDGTPLLKQGKVSPGLYILLDGQADVLVDDQGEEISLETLSPGDMIGEIGLVDPRPSLTSARTQGSAHALFCPRKAFLEFSEHHPSIATFAQQRAQQRIEELEAAISDGDLAEPD